MTYLSKRVLLRERPTGLPTDQTWMIDTVQVEPPGPGELLVRTDHISIDPAMRGWLNDVRSYIPPVRVGEVSPGRDDDRHGEARSGHDAKPTRCR